MIKYILVAVGFFLSSCTYSISIAQSIGKSKDMIDETNSNTPNVSPTIDVPVSVVPK